MITYFIYARKSSESEDRQALSIDAQLSELRTLAARAKLTVVREFTESKSAKQSGRPVFKEMLTHLKRSKVSGILCWKLDRLTRNLLDGATLSDMLENGIIEEIRTPMQVYRNNGADRLMSGIDILFARKFIDDLSENVKRGMNAKVQRGWMPAKAPLGYLNRGLDQGDRTIVPDPKRFELVRRLWDMVLSGSYSVPKILEVANSQWGLRTRSSRRTASKPLSQSGLYKLLSNPFYYGQFRYNGELVQGKHKPMVSFSEYEQVQNLLGRCDAPKPERYRFSFGGTFRCGLCGAMITAENKFKLIKSTGRTKRYIYYHCTYAKDPKCPRQSITEADLMAQVDQRLATVTLPQPVIDWILKYLNAARSTEQGQREKARQSVVKSLATIDRKLQNLVSLRIAPENEDGQYLSDEEFLNQKNALLTELARLKESLQMFNQQDQRLESVAKETFELSRYARAWFQQGGLETRRTILKSIYSNRLLTNKNVQLTPKKPFDVISRMTSLPHLPTATFEPRDLRSPKRKSSTPPDTIVKWRTLVEELGTVLEEQASEFR